MIVYILYKFIYIFFKVLGHGARQLRLEINIETAV